MRTEWPTQAQIIEELADRVASQIDLGRPVAFDGALSELVRYHRFALGLGASTTTDGSPFNYSEIAGADWRAPHTEWLAQYRRLFEKGAERIPDNDHFLLALAYAHCQLLELPEGLLASSALTEAVLNYFPGLIFAVESWVTRRAFMKGEADADGTRHLTLAGSDARAYATTIRGITGAWESLFHHSSALREVGRSQGRTPDKIWGAAQLAWKFIWRHLVNTAFAVAIAVWNDDEEGAAVFREALVRWPENIRYSLPKPLYLALPETLFPDILARDWETAQAMAPSFAYPHLSAVAPGELLAAVVNEVHEDVVQLTASLLAHWSVQGKQLGPLGARVARDLLVQKGGDDHDQYVPPLSASRLFLRFLRLQMAGERFQEETYGATLDDLMRRLDTMTERDVVSGRVYRPSTLSERDEMLWADVAIMATFIDNANAAELNERIRTIAQSDEKLPRGDRSLRDMLDEIDRYLKAVESNAPAILTTIEKLGGEAAEHQLQLLGELLKGAHGEISSYRARQLRERPVDPRKLEERRAAVEEALFDRANLDMFNEAIIVRTDDADAGEVCTYSVPCPKARLINPSMDAEVSGEIEATANGVADWASRRSVHMIFDQPLTNVEVSANPIEREFWDTIQPMISRLGAVPRLLVPRHFQSPLIDCLFRSEASPLKGLTLSAGTSGRDHFLTIEGIEVYAGPHVDTAWLFSAQKLQRLVYGPVEGEQLVAVVFVPGEVELTDGKLEYRFRQSFEWDDSPVYRISLPAARERETVTDDPEPAASPPSVGPSPRPTRIRRKRQAPL